MMLFVPIYQTTNYWPNINRLGCIITRVVRSSVHRGFYHQSGSAVQLVYVASMLHKSTQRYAIKAVSTISHCKKVSTISDCKKFSTISNCKKVSTISHCKTVSTISHCKKVSTISHCKKVSTISHCKK